MPASPTPPIFEQHPGRPFSFYPPILNIVHNEWKFQTATWAEIQVVNVKTGQDVWVPRRFLGETSRVDEPVMIVGLNRELEYTAGTLLPHNRRVVELPPVPGRVRSDEPMPKDPNGSAFAAMTSASGTEGNIGRLVALVLVLAIVAYVFVVTVYKEGGIRSRVTLVASDQSYLELTRNDDYYAVIRKLGQPDEDRWKLDSGELQYRVLVYKQRRYRAILMGTDQKSARYIGTVDPDWNPVHAVAFPSGGGSTMSMLRTLKPF